MDIKSQTFIKLNVKFMSSDRCIYTYSSEDREENGFLTKIHRILKYIVCMLKTSMKLAVAIFYLVFALQMAFMKISQLTG